MLGSVGVRVRWTAHGHGEVGRTSALHVQVTTHPHAVDILAVGQSDTLQLYRESHDCKSHANRI